ncbi:MAG: hypothetical protein KDK51_04470 [Deltaproteobacteria bacterium]|nr:hypothetical protein [Deltaproteobacteria bacterium]
MWIKLDYLIFRPVLAFLLPSSWLIALYSWARPRILPWIAKTKFSAVVVDEPRTYWGQTFRNPLGVAAGFDKDGRLLPFLYRLGAGYVVVGTALDKPHQGNPGVPWVPLTQSHAAINRLGLPSPGIDQVLQNIQDFRRQYNPKDFPIGLSIMGHPLDDADAKAQGMIICMQKAQGFVDFIELNQSCPNVGENLDALDVPASCFEMDIPIVLKLQPMPPQQKIIDLCAQGKISGIVVGNTQKDYDPSLLYAKDQRHARYFQNKYGGGLSGYPLFEENINHIKQWHQALQAVNASTLLIGCGGIRSNREYNTYMQTCGLTQLYTGLWEVYAHVGARKTWAHFFVQDQNA